MEFKSRDCFKNLSIIIDDAVGSRDNELFYYDIQGNNEVFSRNITFDVSDWNDGLEHNVTFFISSNAAGGNGAQIEWFWNKTNSTAYGSTADYIVLQNASSTSYTWPQQHGLLWSCQAQDKDMNESSATKNRSLVIQTFSYCNGTLPIRSYNVSFQDEQNATAQNATANAEFTFANGEYLYSSSTEKGNYTFCTDSTFQNSVDVKFTYGAEDSGDYPIRKFKESYTLNTSLQEQILYLLTSGVGSYSTYTVTTSGGVPIQSVDVGVEKQISGTWTKIQGGETDGSGTIQFWLNPDFTHRFTFTKSGYETVTENIVPTESSYQIQMESYTTNVTYDSDLRGFLWYVGPSSGRLENGQEYNFTFNITTSLNNLYGCEMNLTNESGVILGSVSGCSGNISGGNISLTYTMPNYRVYGQFFIKKDNTSNSYITLDQDMRWFPLSVNATSSGTILDAITILMTAEQFGAGAEQDYSQVYFFFLMLSILIGIITWSTGVELRSPMITITIVAGIVIAFSWAGWFEFGLVPGENDWNAWFSKFALSLGAVFLAVGFIFKSLREGRS